MSMYVYNSATPQSKALFFSLLPPYPILRKSLEHLRELLSADHYPK